MQIAEYRRSRRILAAVLSLCLPEIGLLPQECAGRGWQIGVGVRRGNRRRRNLQITQIAQNVSQKRFVASSAAELSATGRQGSAIRREEPGGASRKEPGGQKRRGQRRKTPKAPSPLSSFIPHDSYFKSCLPHAAYCNPTSACCRLMAAAPP